MSGGIKMMVTTYSEARKTLATVLDRAKQDGAVIITRADGSRFRLQPEVNDSSPFEGISTPIHLPPGSLSIILQDMKEDSGNRYFTK